MLSLERIKELQNVDTELQSTQLENLQDEKYDFCGTLQNVDQWRDFCQEYKDLLELFNNIEEITGFVVLPIDGDLEDFWFTTDSLPCGLDSRYKRLF